jgi:F-type H+-transporting ATPase subunit a
MSEKHSPLAQFEIHPLINFKAGTLDLSFTNASLFMVLAVSAIIFFMIGATRQRAMIPDRWQCMAEMAYEFIANLLRENVGSEGRKFFPLVFCTFMFILLCNLLGMVPYSFTATSHIAVTFSLAAALFLIITAVGFIRHGLHFFSLFAPQGVPTWMMPVIIPIECIYQNNMKYFNDKSKFNNNNNNNNNISQMNTNRREMHSLPSRRSRSHSPTISTRNTKLTVNNNFFI